MTASRVDRVHVRCRAPLSREQAALALRDRLAATARTHLPDALERRLGGGGRRLFVERVGHRLDFDPGAYDDVTVATLWADAIAREVDRAGVDRAGIRVFADDESFVAAAVLEIAQRGALSWWFEELPCGAGRVPVRLVLAALGVPARATAALRALAARPGAALALARRLEPYERSLLGHVLDGALAWDALGLSPTAARAAVVDAGAAAAVPPSAPAATVAGRDASGSAGGGVRPLRPVRSPRAYAASSAPTAAKLVELLSRSAAAGFASLRFDRDAAARTLARRARAMGEHDAAAPTRRRQEPEAQDATADRASTQREPDPFGAPPGWWSTAAGLVYLYPWLGDLLDGGDERERLWLLGALVEPDGEQALVDPFVRLLAGDEPAGDQDPPFLADEATRAAHAVQAEATLASFAALLPGFERSSPAYLRVHVLQRGGLLEPQPDGAYRLVLEPGPLDPVLERLPYPLAAFRLPWAPLVEPERRRA